MREINWRYYFKDSEGSVLTIELTMAQIEGAKSGCIQQLRKHFKDCELLDRVEGTGLFDNTGKEIFEKDIVCAYNGKYIGEVVYFPPVFVVQNLKDMRLNFLEPNGKNKINFDVIGNVYQNPQLLEAEVELLRKHLEFANNQCEDEITAFQAELAKLRKVVEAARAYLDQINKRTKSMGLDMSNYHALSITVKPGDAGKDYWQAVWALQQALTELDKEGE